MLYVKLYICIHTRKLRSVVLFLSMFRTGLYRKMKTKFNFLKFSTHSSNWNTEAFVSCKEKCAYSVTFVFERQFLTRKVGEMWVMEWQKSKVLFVVKWSNWYLSGKELCVLVVCIVTNIVHCEPRYLGLNEKAIIPFASTALRLQHVGQCFINCRNKRVKNWKKLKRSFVKFSLHQIRKPRINTAFLAWVLSHIYSADPNTISYLIRFLYPSCASSSNFYV